MTRAGKLEKRMTHEKWKQKWGEYDALRYPEALAALSQ